MAHLSRFTLQRVAPLAILLLLCVPYAHAQQPFGSALTFDGDDYVDIPNDPILNIVEGEDFTLSARFRTDRAGQQRILFKYGPGGGYAFLLVYGQIRAFMWSSGGPSAAVELDSPRGFPWPDSSEYHDDALWHQVALVRQGADVILYVDGLKAMSGQWSDASLENDAPLRIGADSAEPARFHFKGQIDEIRLWKVARSISQIRATLNDTLGPAYYAAPDSGLIAYYRMDALEDLGVEADGPDDIRDLSLHGNHGDLIGDATLEEVVVEEAFVRPRLVLQFSQMDEHIGERLDVRVIDAESGDIVARQWVKAIDNADFEMWLNALIMDRSYRVDFYADHNASGEYEPAGRSRMANGVASFGGQ